MQRFGFSFPKPVKPELIANFEELYIDPWKCGTGGAN